MISPVVAGNQSLSRATHERATALESVTSQPSGARSSHTSSNRLKPGIDFAAIVFTGPAAMRLQRIPGCRPLNAGELSNAMAIEAFTAVLLNLNVRYKTRAAPKFPGIRS